MEVVRMEQFVGDGKIKYIALIRQGLRQCTGIGLTKNEAIEKAKNKLLIKKK